MGYLDQPEQAGHAWRAAVVRHSRSIPANRTEELSEHVADRDYCGRVTVDAETLLIVARTGYRPRLTRLLLVIVGV